jgi:hypothetical protein
MDDEERTGAEPSLWIRAKNTPALEANVVPVVETSEAHHRTTAEMRFVRVGGVGVFR